MIEPKSGIYLHYNFSEDTEENVMYDEFIDDVTLNYDKDKEDYHSSIRVFYDERAFIFHIFMDDYGQCYYMKFTDTKGESREVGCGTYNFDYIGEAVGMATILANKLRKEEQKQNG